MTKKSFTLLIICLCLLSLPSPSLAMKYRLCFPQGSLPLTYSLLVKSLPSKGLTEKDLTIEAIDLTSNQSDLRKSQIRKELFLKCDLFFATGDSRDILFSLEPQTPVLFIGTANPDESLPPSMTQTATGFFWESTTTVLKRSSLLLPPDQRKTMGFLHIADSTINSRTPKYHAAAQKAGINLIVKSYGEQRDIGEAMKELKEQGANGLILFPPSIRQTDLPEVIKWQNILNLPVISQIQGHIEKGCLGGPTIDFNKLIPILADYTSKILKGRRPGTLPVLHFSRKYVINIDTVRELNLRIPEEVLAQAELVTVPEKSMLENRGKQ